MKEGIVIFIPRVKMVGGEVKNSLEYNLKCGFGLSWLHFEMYVKHESLSLIKFMFDWTGIQPRYI